MKSSNPMGEPIAASAEPPVPFASATVKPARKNIVFVVGLIGVVGVIIALVLVNFKDSTVYAKGLDQVVADRDRWVGRTVRVEGTLMRGTLKFREKPCEYEFDATRNGATLRIRYPSCIKPDSLRDDMPDVGVTAEGKLLASGEFQATNVLAKCPSKYEMKDKAQKNVSDKNTNNAPLLR